MSSVEFSDGDKIPKSQEGFQIETGHAYSFSAKSLSSSDVPTAPPLPTAPAIPTPPPLTLSESSIQPDKAPEIRVPMEHRIRQVVDQRNLKRIGANFQRALSSSQTTSYEIPLLAKTQNPVGVIGGAQFIPKTVAEGVIKKECTTLVTPKSFLKLNVGTFYSKDEILSGLRVKLAVLTATKENEELPIDKEQEAQKITALIKAISALPGLYITLNIEEILSKVDGVGIDKTFINETLNSIVASGKGCVEYVSSTKLMAALVAENHLTAEESTEFLDKMIERSGIQEPKFVVKTGKENIRETLGGQIAADMGLSAPLALKSKVQLPDQLKLKEQAISSGNPIASQFVEGGTKLAKPTQSKKSEQLAKQIKENEVIIKKLESTKASKKESIATMEKSRISILYRFFGTLKKEQEALAFLERRSSALTHETEGLKVQIPVQQDYEKQATSDMQKLCILDLVLQSTDSHTGQFIQTEDGHVHNIDFARFLPPADTFQLKGGTIPNFCSCLLDFPFAKEGIPQNLQDQILAWNIDKLEDQWKEKGLIHTQVEFDAHKRVFAGLIEDRELLNNPETGKADIIKIAKKYGLKHEPYNKTAIINKFEEIYQSKKKEEQGKGFGKIGPPNLIQLKKRVIALQQYIRDCQGKQPPTQPTSEGAFAKMYPNLAPFLKAVNKMTDGRGGSSLAGSGEYQSLETIIKDAIKSDKFTRQEITEMEEALGRLKQDTTENSELYISQSA